MSKNFFEIKDVTFAIGGKNKVNDVNTVSYTHLRAHET